MSGRLIEPENKLLKFSFACKDCLEPFLMPFLALMFSLFTAFSLFHSVQKNASVIALASVLIVGGIFYCLNSLTGLYCKEGLRNCFKKEIRQTLIVVLKWFLWIASIILILVVVILDAFERPQNLISLVGLTTLVLVCFVFSTNPALVEWRLIFCGMLLQCLMGLAVMRCRAVFDAVTWVANQITGYLGCAKPAAIFLFGENYKDHEFLMGLTAVGVFFNSTSYFLYHVGILQITIRAVGSAFSLLIPATRVECFAAVSNIFFGPDATMMMVKPMISSITKAQLHTLLSAGMASIDAGMIPIFESIGIPANHLLSASLMSAPAAIVFSRLLTPEEEKIEDCKSLTFERTQFSGTLEAIHRGARDGLTFSFVILSVLLAYVSLLEFVNCTFIWFGNRVGIEELTLQVIASYVFLPVVFVMGVEGRDCLDVSKLVALKTILNEFIAYEQLSQLISNRERGLEPSISVRSEAISSYALCGFSNIGTVGTLVGFVAAIAPDRKSDVSKMAVRCLVASSCACFSTACVAALFYTEN